MVPLRWMAWPRPYIVHPDPARVARLLSSLKLEAPVVVLPTQPGQPAGLVAHIHTPQGLRVLSVPQAVSAPG